MKRRAARLIAIVAVCFAAVFLTGCGASLTVYDYTSGGVRYNEYELKIPSAAVRGMEASATTDANGDKYTVSGYFYTLFTDFGYELVEATNTEAEYTVRYRKAYSNGEPPELYELGTTPTFDTVHTENPFVRYYTSVSPNPFNGVRAAYDEIERGASDTLPERIKNGYVVTNEYNERVVIFPGITDAFPYIKGLSPDGLLLGYARTGSKRTDVSGSKEPINDTTSKQVFVRYFDRTDTEIALAYTRPVPYGWYMTAIAAGAVTLTIFVIATRTKKQKPTLLDRFPYNPEQYRDYDSHLPSNL